MGCSPGTPCNPYPLPMVYAAYSGDCANIPNGCCPTSKTLYDGPNLPNTGIENKDNVSVAFDKIDDALDPTTIVQNFINIISANPPLAVLFCDLVGNCPTISTTSTTSTTTITTTACPQTNLYNYYTIEDVRNITPAGWHVPSIAEWNTLISTQGGYTYDLIDPLGWIASSYWGDPNELTNGTGLSLRKNNNRQENGLFFYDYYSLYWTTTDQSPGLKHTAGVYGCCGDLYPNDEPRGPKAGIAIRLIKDDSTDTGTMVGNDERIYPTVKIGTQVWMAEDLKETKYRNGDSIPVVTSDNAWSALTTGARCLFLNEVCCDDPSPCIEYSIYGSESFSFEYDQCSDGTTQIYTGTEVYGKKLCAAWNSINVLTGSVNISYDNRCGCGIDIG